MKTAIEKPVAATALSNIHPGTILALDYFPEMGVTKYALAKALRITPTQLGELMQGQRNVTANIALRLGALFGQTPQFWLNLQNTYDMRLAQERFGAEIEKIKPFEWPKADTASTTINKAPHPALN